MSSKDIDSLCNEFKEISLKELLIKAVRLTQRTFNRIMFIKIIVTSVVTYLITSFTSRKDEIRDLIFANALTASRINLLSCTIVNLFVRISSQLCVNFISLIIYINNV